MKKTLVALAALAATTAFAQSTVAITGNIDLGYSSTKQTGYTGDNGTGTDATSPVVTKKTVAPIGKANTWSSNAIKLSVTEDMGNGKKAGYVGEMNVGTFGTGVDAADQLLGTTRQAFAFLSDAKMGEIRYGYQYTLDDQVQGGVGRATPTGNTGGRVQNFGNIGFAVKPNSAALASSTVAQEGRDNVTSGNIVRVNAIEYSTPAFNGFTVKGQWASQAVDTTNATGASAGKADGKVAALAALYSNGPLNLGLSSTSIKSDGAGLGITTKSQNVEHKLTNLAANYDMGVAKVFFNSFSRTSDITQDAIMSVGGTAANIKANVYGAFGATGGQIKRTGNDLGVSVPFGAVTLFASTGSGHYKTTVSAGSAQEDSKVKGRLLGATYDFSKRTSLNAYYSTTKLSGADDVALKNTIIGAGLRHQF
jgi:predicted porin